MTDTAEFEGFIVHIERGVMVVRITHDSMLSVDDIDVMKNRIVELLPLSNRAVVVDCQMLTGQVSSQFLDLLMSVSHFAEKSGLQAAVCGLTGSLGKAFKISHYELLVPTFGTTSDAVQEFGEYDEKAARKKQREVIKQIEFKKQRLKRTMLLILDRLTTVPQTISREVLVGFLTTVMLIGYLAFLIPQFMTKTKRGYQGAIYTRKDTSIFKIDIDGHVSHGAGGELSADEGAMVIIWPKTFVPRTQLATKYVAEQADATANEGTGIRWPIVTRVNKRGRYEVAIQARGRAAELYVMYISQRKAGAGVRPEDLDALSPVFADPKSLIDDRDYSIITSVVFPHSDPTLDWQF